jgi:hypothetical protein
MTFDEWAKERELNTERTKQGNYNYIETGDFFECWQAARLAALNDAIVAVEDSGGDNTWIHIDAIKRLRDLSVIGNG